MNLLDLGKKLEELYKNVGYMYKGATAPQQYISPLQQTAQTQPYRQPVQQPNLLQRVGNPLSYVNPTYFSRGFNDSYGPIDIKKNVSQLIGGQRDVPNEITKLQAEQNMPRVLKPVLSLATPPAGLMQSPIDIYHGIKNRDVGRVIKGGIEGFGGAVGSTPVGQLINQGMNAIGGAGAATVEQMKGTYRPPKINVLGKDIGPYVLPQAVGTVRGITNQQGIGPATLKAAGAPEWLSTFGGMALDIVLGAKIAKTNSEDFAVLEKKISQVLKENNPGLKPQEITRVAREFLRDPQGRFRAANGENITDSTGKVMWSDVQKLVKQDVEKAANAITGTHTVKESGMGADRMFKILDNKSTQLGLSTKALSPEEAAAALKAKNGVNQTFNDVPSIRKEIINTLQGGGKRFEELFKNIKDPKTKQQYIDELFKMRDEGLVANSGGFTKPNAGGKFIDVYSLSQPQVGQKTKVPAGNQMDRSLEQSVPQNLGTPYREPKLTGTSQPRPLLSPEENLKQPMSQNGVPVSSNESIPLGGKERGFVTSVKEAPRVTEPTQAGTSGTYTQKPNTELMGEAKALLVEGGKIDLKGVKGADTKVAATIQEALNLDKSGNPEAAANLFNNLSEYGTELGRGVQAFTMLDKMSPEAIALSAAGKIKKYNATARVKIPELTGDQVSFISNAVDKLRQLPEGRERNIAMNELQKTISEFIPSSLSDKLITIWKAGLLTSPRTHIRNTLGNLIHGTTEVAKDVPATLVDKVLALKTGKREITFTTKGTGEAFSKKTWTQVKDILFKGYDPEQAINKFDTKSINWGNGPIGKAAKVYTESIFRLLNVADKPFYNAAMARSLWSQAGAMAENAGKSGSKEFIEGLVKSPTEQMITTALNDANIATFKNRNYATNIASAIKREMSKNGVTHILSEVTMPFTGVPSSVLGQTIAYSPLGLVKGAIGAGRVLAGQVPELQRQAAQEIGRGVIGTGLFGLGAYLMSNGIMTGQPKDATEARQWELENKPRNSIMIGGKWRSLNSIGPEAVVVLSGAKLQEEMSKPEGSLGTFAFNTAKDQLDQSFVTGLQQPVNALTDPSRYGKSYAGNQIASVVPNIVKDVSKSSDQYARETNSITDYAKNATPILRNTLLPRRDALGNIIPQEPTGASSFIDVFNSKTPVNDPVVNELSRLNSVGQNSTPGKISNSQTIRGEKTKLTPEQLDVFESQVGDQAKTALAQVISSPGYQSLDDESKAKAIDTIMTNARKYVKDRLNVQDTSGITKVTPTTQLTDSKTYKIDGVDVTGTISSGKFMYTDPETGDFVSTPVKTVEKKQIDDKISLNTAKMTNLQDKEDYAGWTKVAESQLATLEDQYTKATTEQDKLDYENKITDLVTNMAKYKSYGGAFKKPKKPAKIAYKTIKSSSSSSPKMMTIKKSPKVTIKATKRTTAKPKIAFTIKPGSSGIRYRKLYRG